MTTKPTSRPVQDPSEIERILILRMHAIGDVALTFPACASLRRQYPKARIDFLTSEIIAPLVMALDLFDEVIPFPHCQTRFERIFHTLKMQAVLSQRSYQVVLDLQSNWVSKSLRRLSRVESWSEFDRTSPIPAAVRVMNACKAAGFLSLEPDYDLPIRASLISAAGKLLEQCQRDPHKKLLVLNPAGLWKTRQWPDEYYINLAHAMTETGEWQIVFLGTSRIRPRVNVFIKGFNGRAIDLVEKTDLPLALAVLQRVSLVISEDSGLMHMAWVSGVPTIAILGSTRADWAMPIGQHTTCLHSGDLPCGSCMKEECIFGDVHCLTRYRPEEILSLAAALTKADSRAGLVQ